MVMRTKVPGRYVVALDRSVRTTTPADLGVLCTRIGAQDSKIWSDAMPRKPSGATGLALLLATAGMSHFAMPKPYDAIVPGFLPGSPRTWTYLSGVAELAVAAAVAVPRSRRAGALAAAALFVAVFPANVKMAYDWRHRRPAHRIAAYARLPMQAPLIMWALRVARHPHPADLGSPALGNER
jgi:uncharacterized membrane protein